MVLIYITDPFPSLLVASKDGLMYLDLFTRRGTPIASGNVDKVDFLHDENVRYGYCFFTY